MLVSKIPESQLPVKSVDDSDYVRVVGADGKSFRVRKTDFNTKEKGVSEDLKVALLQIAAKVAYIDEHGQDYYDALEAALYPPIGLVSIAAVFDAGGATIYNTDTLEDLKQYLTVTATYSDQSTEVIENYTLSGTLSVGTSTITATYGGKTDTFSVTVDEWLVSIAAVYTQSGTVYDTASLDDLKSDLVVTATYADTTTETIVDYALSGTLEVGTSTITVSYGGLTDTFTVTVSESSRLPVGYTEYDYIAQSSTVGTALTANSGILTGIRPSPTGSIELDIKYTNDTNTKAQCVFGTRAGSGGGKNIGLFITPSTGKMGYWFGGTDTTVDNSPFSANTKHKVKVQPVGVSQTYSADATINVDGTDYDTGSTVDSGTWSQWFGLFMYAISASSTSTTTTNLINFGLQIGEVIFRDSSNIITHDLVPAYNGTYYGFYDLVTDTFFNNGAIYTGGNWT